jgi:hypothetical protein
VAAQGLSRGCPVVYCAQHAGETGADDAQFEALAARARGSSIPFEMLSYHRSLESVVDATLMAARTTGASPLIIVDDCLTLIEDDGGDSLVACEEVATVLTMLSIGLGCTVLGLAALSSNDAARLCERQDMLTRRDAPAGRWLPALCALLPHTIISIQPIGPVREEPACAAMSIVTKERPGEQVPPLLVRLGQEFTAWRNDS